MNCSVCQNEIIKGDRIVYNHRHTFVFKPANVEDTVNPAEVSSAELAESRKEHTRTEIATTYTIMGEGTIEEGAFGIRHQDCVRRTGERGNLHGVNKHAIRWRSQMRKR